MFFLQVSLVTSVLQQWTLVVGVVIKRNAKTHFGNLSDFPLKLDSATTGSACTITALMRLGNNAYRSVLRSEKIERLKTKPVQKQTLVSLGLRQY